MKRNVHDEYRQAIIDYLIRRDGLMCGICFEMLEQPFQIDHILPVKRGGEHVLDNFRVTHAACNSQRARAGELSYWDAEERAKLLEERTWSVEERKRRDRERKRRTTELRKIRLGIPL